MMGRSHLVISTGITLSVLGMADEKITLPVIAITAVSALLPDIDEPNSLLVTRSIPTRFLRFFQLLLIISAVFIQFIGTAFAPWNSVIAVLVGLVSFMPTRTLRNIVMFLIGLSLIVFGQFLSPWNYIVGSTLMICAIVKHRGLTHTLYFVVGWTALLFFASHAYGNALWIAGGLSCLLHLLCDAITNHGIQPLPPFKFRFKLRLMSTGTWTGTIVESLCIGLTFALVWIVFARTGNWHQVFIF